MNVRRLRICYLKCRRVRYNAEHPSKRSITICNFPGKTSRTEALCFTKLTSIRANVFNKMSFHKLHKIDTFLNVIAWSETEAGRKTAHGSQSRHAIAIFSRLEAREYIFPLLFIYSFSTVLFTTTNFRDARRSLTGDTGKEEAKRRRGEKVVYLHAHSDRSSLRELKHQAK